MSKVKIDKKVVIVLNTDIQGKNGVIRVYSVLDEFSANFPDQTTADRIEAIKSHFKGVGKVEVFVNKLSQEKYK